MKNRPRPLLIIVAPLLFCISTSFSSHYDQNFSLKNKLNKTWYCVMQISEDKKNLIPLDKSGRQAYFGLILKLKTGIYKSVPGYDGGFGEGKFKLEGNNLILTQEKGLAKNVLSCIEINDPSILVVTHYKVVEREKWTYYLITRE